VTTTGQLQAIFHSPAGMAEWPALERELAAFGITTLAGGVNPGDRRALYSLVRALKPCRILEIGTHIGASTAHLAVALRTNAAAGGPTGILTTVDIEDVNSPATEPWRRYGSTLAPAEMMRRLGIADRVSFVVRKSLQFLRDGTERWDLIFLDGDHSAATVYQELPAALARLTPGGVVLLHDYFPNNRPLWPGDPVIPGPWLGVERLRQEGAALTVLPFGDLPWPTKLGRSVTSLAAASPVTGSLA